MYSSSSSILALRTKGSPYHHHHHHHHCFSGDGAAVNGGCCSPGAARPPCAAAAGFSDCGFFASPRFLYGYWLRQSALIRWAPSRIILSSGCGAAAARYSRLAAAWDGDPCADGEWRRLGRCGNRRVSCRAGFSDGSFRDVLGLLAEVEECLGEYAAAADGAAEETYVRGKVGFKPRGRFYDNEGDSAREDDGVALGSESSSSYQSASSFSSISGDSGRSKAVRRRGGDGSSSNYGRNEDIAEKEVREVRTCEDDSRSRRRYQATDRIGSLDRDTRKREVRTRGGEDNAASLRGSARQSRGQYVQNDQCFTGQKESKEELQRLSKTSHERQSSATERNVGDKRMFSVMKEETSVVDLLEEVRRQRNEIEQLRKDYQSLLRTTQVCHVYDTKTSASSNVFNTRVENLNETSTLQMGLLEEVRRQRIELEQLNENYQKLMHKMQESSMIRESNSTKSFGARLENREEGSTSAINLVEEGGAQYHHTDKQTIDDSLVASQRLTGTNVLKKYRQGLKTSDIHESDIRRNSNYKMGRSTIVEEREKKEVSAINLVEEVQQHHTNISQNQQNFRYTNLGTSSHKLTERADIHSNNTETASRSQRHYMTRTDDQQECTSSSVKLTEAREEQVSNINEKVSEHIDSRRNSQKLTDVVETHKSDVTKTSRTQDHVKTTVKDQEESSMSIQHLVKLRREKRVQIDQQVIEETNVSKDTRSCINISQASGAEAGNSSATFSNHGKNAVSALNPVHEVQHLRNEDGEQVTQQLRSRNDSQQGAPEFFEGGPVRVSDLQMSSGTRTKNGVDYSSLVLVQEAKEKEKINLLEETFGASRGTSEGLYSSGHLQTHELDYHTKSDGFHLNKDDVLESARRLDKSSSHYVGEFVDQLHQKVSASEETDTTSYDSPETQVEAGHSPFQKPKATDEYKGDITRKEGSSRHSAKSEVAGPSDEIWDVKGASSQEPSLTEEPEKDSSSARVLGTTGASASTGGAIIKRSSKSLWSYIADIVQMGWIARSSSQKSTLKFGTRSSSNESMNSDAWYSGHEPEDDQEENVKNGQLVMKQSESNKAAVSKPQSRTSSASGQVASEVTSQGAIMQVEFDASIPNESIGGSYGSNGPPPSSSLENLVMVVGGKGIEGMPSAAATASQSTLLGSTLVSTSEEETEIDGIHVAEVGFIKSEEEQKTERIPEVAGIEGKDVELKRRKLQRKKQVLREEFEEWEEAYKLETEQRKIDEFFMREALLEAKKAADMWEVPVGAVLVQDGKIIARGCNLVEDLRDSTAHAEMICIREASSILRTWRLAGTTLYVTLEPCPMCAGAILQARVDAVVWGSPNKLLGADGSWVRLFPGGEEGKQDLDQSSQMVGPVHPFHPKITIRRGVLAMECADAMQQFFQRRRKKKKPEPPPPSCLPINYPAKLLTKMHNIFSMMVCM